MEYFDFFPYCYPGTIRSILHRAGSEGDEYPNAAGSQKELIMFKITY